MSVELGHVQRLATAPIVGARPMRTTSTLLQIISPPPPSPNNERAPPSELRLFVLQEGSVVSATSSAAAPIEEPIANDQERLAQLTLMNQLCDPVVDNNRRNDNEDDWNDQSDQTDSAQEERHLLAGKNKPQLERLLVRHWPFRAGRRVRVMNADRYGELFCVAAIVRALSINASQVCELIRRQLPSARNLVQYAHVICDKLARNGMFDPRAGELRDESRVMPRQLSLECMIAWRLIKPPTMRVLLNLDVSRFDRVLYTLRRRWLTLYHKSQEKRAKVSTQPKLDNVPRITLRSSTASKSKSTKRKSTEKRRKQTMR